MELVTLDSMASCLGRVSLIKYDVEGHEWSAIKGSRRVIEAHRPLVIFEQHQHDFRSGYSPVVVLLQELGYQRFAVPKLAPAIRSLRFRTLNKFYHAFASLVVGRNMTIVEVDEIKPGDYAQIWAIPDRLS